VRRKRTFLAEFPLGVLLFNFFDVAVAAGENSYANFFWLFAAHGYGADAILVCEHGACRDGKRLRRT